MASGKISEGKMRGRVFYEDRFKWGINEQKVTYVNGYYYKNQLRISN